MRELTKTVYEAFDGTQFETVSDCRAHEKDNIHLALVGLTAEQVDAAMSRDDKHLGDAIEAVATMIKQKRLADGDLKRRRGSSGDADPVTEPASETTSATEPMTDSDLVNDGQPFTGETSSDLLGETVAA